MEGRSFSVIRLIQSRLYPTYQLFATMANSKTTPQDGLRIAALTTMAWLRDRLVEDVPEAFRTADPEQYRSIGNDALPSLRISKGFVIDIVSLPEQGIWSLQITEPDLGSEPGNPDQKRQPVPGRVIETNIGFRIFGQALECAFQTVISDPETVTEPCDVYRLAVIKKLMRNPAFGLRQLARLEETPVAIQTADQQKRFAEIVKSPENQLPVVLFTEAAQAVEEIPLDAGLGGLSRPRLPGIPASALSSMPYDPAAFAKAATGFCRVCTADASIAPKLLKAVGLPADQGAIVVFHPVRTGEKPTVYPLKPSKQRQEETMQALRTLILSYPRGRSVNFGHVRFLGDARESLVQSVEDSAEELQRAKEAHAESKESLKADLRSDLAKKDAQIADLTEQLARQKEYQTRLEGEKADLMAEMDRQKAAYEKRLHEEDEYLEYLERKLDRPSAHSEIAAWARRYFGGRLLLHPKAASLLEDRSAQEVDLGLICDALDFLATDYWENRYQRISEDEMNLRCSRKYNRPFEIKPTGTTTIEFTPNEYKIKYRIGAKGKPVETPLDFHLGVGSSPENLLRIYFLHDDKEKLIVVGSLPRHLRAVTIK